MSSQPRNNQQAVSLPSIHELFPEHLMNAPQSPPSSTMRSRPAYSYPRSSLPPSSPSRVGTYQTHRGHSRQPSTNESFLHASSTTRPTLSVPHDSWMSLEGSRTTQSQSMSMPMAYDPHRHDGRMVSIPSPRAPKNRNPSAHHDIRSMPYTGSSPSTPPFEEPENLTDEEPSVGSSSGIPRKHICPICHKAFNRPSSLKIHYNTHTGATPFRCPWPKCGREFNVNSNMRRHYRNHTANANQEAINDGSRRRRRRSSVGSNPQPLISQSTDETRAHLPNSLVLHQDPSAQHRYKGGYGYRHEYKEMDTEEVDHYHVPEDGHRSDRLAVPILPTSLKDSDPRGLAYLASRYHGAPVPQSERSFPYHSHFSSSSSMRIRAVTPGSSFHSSSPSPSPSPSLASSGSPFNSPPPSRMESPSNSPALPPQVNQYYQYSPSMPYLRSAGDPHVSTALRPAFNAGSTVSGRR